MTREEKLESIAKIFAKIMFYGDWKWETPNERVLEMLMREVDLYPFPDEDTMIIKTEVDENLYSKAVKEIKVYSIDCEDTNEIKDPSSNTKYF